MNDNWFEIVQMLKPHFYNNSTEDIYQKEVESCMQILGWKRWNNSLQTQCTIPIGNNNNIRLDILLSKNNVNVLPIEIKRPSNLCTERQEQQLMSYMRMLRINVGMYIGEEIRLYYDNPNDSLEAVCVFSSKIDNDSKNGIKLCELLTYSDFESEKLELFCKEQYNNIQAQKNFQNYFADFFSLDSAEQNMISLIKEKFINEGYEESIIDNEIKYLHLSISYIPRANITPVIRPVNNDTIIINTPTTGTNRLIENRRERKQYTRTASKSELIVKFDDGTIIRNSSAIEVERQFIIKVGIERVRSLGITQCHEDLIGKPSACRNPEKYINRWTPLMNGLYLFNCSNNGDKKKHIERIISCFNIKAKVEIIR